MNKISIVIPVYNESKNIDEGALSRVINYTDNLLHPFEVILVDDGSEDNTVQLIEHQIRGKKGYRLIKNPHGGKAITVITGILAAEGAMILFTDMDQSTPLREAEKFISHLAEGSDIVIGIRHGRQDAPSIRRLYAWGFTTLSRAILGLPFSDTQCGFKAFNKKAAQLIFPELFKHWQNMKNSGAAVNAGFDIEMLYLAQRKGFKITGVPVEWRYIRSKRVNIRSALEAFTDILRISLNGRRGVYDLPPKNRSSF